MKTEAELNAEIDKMNQMAFDSLVASAPDRKQIKLQKIEADKKIKPRPYQNRFRDEFLSTTHMNKNGRRRMSLQLGCGLGKTLQAVMIAYTYLVLGKQILFISPNKTALGDESQGNIKDFYSYFGGSSYKIGNVVDEYDSRNSVHFFTIRGIVKLSKEVALFKKFMENVGFIIIDEAHKAPKDDSSQTVYIGRIHEMFEEEFAFADILTCTATHDRMDGLPPVGKEKADIIYRLGDAMLEGGQEYVPIIAGVRVIIKAKIAGSSVTNDNYNLKFTGNNYEAYWKEIVDYFYNNCYQYYKDAGHVYFVSSQEDARYLKKKLNERLGKVGFDVLLSQDVPGKIQTMEERNRIIEDIISGKLLGYITVNVGGDAINIPRLEFAHMIAPSKSRNKVAQNFGRITRKHPGKLRAVIIDYGVCRAEVMRGCIGFAEYAKQEGSKLDINKTIVGHNLFKSRDDQKKKKGTTFKGMLHGVQEDWISVEIIGRMNQLKSENKVKFLQMLDAAEPRPTFHSHKLLRYELNAYTTPSCLHYDAAFDLKLRSHRNAHLWFQAPEVRNTIHIRKKIQKLHSSMLLLPKLDEVDQAELNVKEVQKVLTNPEYRNLFEQDIRVRYSSLTGLKINDALLHKFILLDGIERAAHIHDRELLLCAKIK